MTFALLNFLFFCCLQRFVVCSTSESRP